MSATINTGWLKGKNGVKFAPKTLSSQVITNDGIALEEKIAADLNEIRTYIDETVSGNEGGGPHDHNDTYYTESEIDSMLSTTASTIKNDLLNGAGEAYDTLKELSELIDENTDTIEALELIAAAKMDKNDPVGTGSFSLNRKTGSNVGLYSFTEGSQNIASSYAAHAEGSETAAYSYAAHAEGWKTTANGDYSHVEGEGTIAAGRASHAEGSNTIASIEGQHVEGKYNIEDTAAIHVVGNGTSDTKRSNAHTIELNGEAWYSGDIYVGSTSGTHKDEGSKKVATENYVDKKVTDLVNAAPETLDTLGELATAFNNNQDLLNILNEAIVNKVDKEEDKGLSTNDYTNEDKTTLADVKALSHKNYVTSTFLDVTLVEAYEADIASLFEN